MSGKTVRKSHERYLSCWTMCLFLTLVSRRLEKAKLERKRHVQQKLRNLHNIYISPVGGQMVPGHSPRKGKRLEKKRSKQAFVGWTQPAADSSFPSSFSFPYHLSPSHAISRSPMKTPNDIETHGVSIPSFGSSFHWWEGNGLWRTAVRQHALLLSFLRDRD